MIYEVTITDQADADLRGIYEYIAFELLSPDHAAMPVDNYLVYPISHRDAGIVAVIRVMYAGKDVDSQLKIIQ